MGYQKLKIGDRIHLHSRQGIYTIKSIHKKGFFVETKSSTNTMKLWSDFKCLAGQHGQGKSVPAIERQYIRMIDEKINELSLIVALAKLEMRINKV